VIIREKLGRTFLGIEYHWDTSELHGTAKPFIKLAGLVAPDQRRPALEAAHALISASSRACIIAPEPPGPRGRRRPPPPRTPAAMQALLPTQPTL
jgi:hypothetical protein